MTHDDQPQDPQPGSTAYLLQEMQLYGYRSYDDEPDHRPLPDDRIAGGAVAEMFDALVSCLIDTRIEPDLEDLAWGIVNVFHRAGERVERELDDNEQAQKRMQREQDGSEVKSVELERAIAEGITMLERRDTMEYFRDAAADQFRIHLRKPWLPRSGPMVNHKTLTSAVLDSRKHVDKRAFQKQRLLDPDGVRIAFTGGADFNDHQRIYAVLDKVHQQLPTLILMHGATPTGAERIAACWARDRNVPQDPYRPDWNRHKKAAPFKRNDAMLETCPKGVIIFPGTGIQDNLADKARKMGIRVWDFRKRAG
ncbi:hypothetical protein EBBID32_39460 [Sphingobium indicum BiD32]|uniref:YspA cpYpsA-related SLOG domain-containing protein n=2 Tax=Sphingobium TaxID=165695 RepID=N1MWB0_9SPHN|nr:MULTISPECIES: DUF2493 domain-containing protein [Sphingobium]GBH32749.1 hypothetical protein MBESOW_P3980 [Sphingobium xenophagum]CCW19578.1 hypothetical protein EBBID32_39460 [Sphingobium indicum BiD32]